MTVFALSWLDFAPVWGDIGWLRLIYKAIMFIKSLI